MLVGESKTVRAMRRFLRKAQTTESILIGGEAGTGRMGMVRRICKKAGMKPSDQLRRTHLFDGADFPDTSFKKGSFIVTDNRTLFDEMQETITQSFWIAPLRERVEDIPLLVDYFAKKVTEEKWSSSSLMEKLLSYWWPLNVFELKRVITSPHGADYLPWTHKDSFLSGLSVKELISLKMNKYWASLEHGRAPGEFFHLFLDSVEREFIESALEYCDNSRHKTAQLLDIHRNTLTKKMRKLGIKG